MDSRKRFLLVFAVFFCLFAGSGAVAQSTEDLAKVEKKLTQQKESAAQLEEKERKTNEELEGLRGKLIEATDALQDKEKEQQRLESRLNELEKDVLMREAFLGRSREKLMELVSAILRLNRRPPALFLLFEKSEEDHVHRTILLRSMLPRLRDETAKLIKEIDGYEILRNQTAAQKKVVTAAQQNLEWQRHSLDQMIQSRQGMLQKTSAEKAAITKRLEALSGEAKDLRQLMEKVSNPSWGAAMGKGVDTSALRMRSGLKIPVVGEVVRDYGAKDDFGVSSEGVTVRGAPGGLVVAPQSGKVVFAGPFRGYGQIVILQHPKGYHSFLAGFGRIDADMGQAVEAGEPLGALPAQGKPELYFEWRKGDSPVDPTSSGLAKR